MPQPVEKKEFLGFKFKVEKASSDENTGYVEGFASTFGNVDQGFDIVERGAFARTIENKKGKFPILLDHNPCEQAGWNVEAEETDKGLRVKGELKLFDPRVRQRYELAKAAFDHGCPMGLSIGYSVIKADYANVTREGQEVGVRLLKELKLWEYSLVTFPMNEEATLTGAKAAAWTALFARLQNGNYDLERVQKALEAIDRDAGDPQPATIEADPEFLHSVDRLIGNLRG